MAAVSEPGAEPAAVAARAVTKRTLRSRSSFYWGMRLLPAERRRATYAIYAFCREVDDIADGTLPRADKLAGLELWRREIADLYGGRPQLPTGRGLLGAVAAYDLRRADFLAVIDGMEMDAASEIRAPSLADLELYAGRVAGAVGRLCVRVFGCSGPAADEVADSLGRALQYTNILRDLAEDAARGRLYLPRELIRAHGIASEEPGEVLAHPALPAACRDLAEIAERDYVAATKAMARCPRRAMRPAAVMAAIYRTLLERLSRRGWALPGKPVRVPLATKLWLVLRWGLL